MSNKIKKSTSCSVALLARFHSPELINQRDDELPMLGAEHAKRRLQATIGHVAHLAISGDSTGEGEKKGVDDKK